MKKTLLALSLIACLLLTFVACNDDEIDSEFKNAPTESTADGGNGTGDSNTTDGTGTTSTNDGTSNTGLSGGGANTEGGWGPIITP